MKTAVVLFNLGGPDTPDAIEPFLRNLFSDPAILPLPAFVRRPLANMIARKRAPVAKEIYAHIGGHSPILPQTEAQRAALEAVLGPDYRVFIAMRCWKPFSDEAATAAKAWGAENVVLLPLYPQFSVTTTGSSFADWDRAAAVAGLSVPTRRICCYPTLPGFIAAVVASVRQAKRKPGVSYRLLLSAHGLPQRVIDRGDPYQMQVEQTAAAVVRDAAADDAIVCYQSRVGPLKWIGPATDAEIVRAGTEGLGIVLAPIAFVSEHSETLVELDIEYAKLAREAGVRDYIRVPTVGCDAEFVAGLADLVLNSTDRNAAPGGGEVCRRQHCRCAYR